MRHAYQRGGMRGLNYGVMVGAVALLGLAMAQGEREAVMLAFACLAGAAFGGLVGFLLGSGVTRPLPIQVRRYRPDAGTLQIRFQDPHYADLVLAASSRKSGGA
jgi:membrane protein YqaA with SNARE-associated domain